VNPSRFAGRITGCGGGIDLSRNARKMVICGTFAAKAGIALAEGKLSLANRVQVKKFVTRVELNHIQGHIRFFMGVEGALLHGISKFPSLWRKTLKWRKALNQLKLRRALIWKRIFCTC
jgi:hypothetical protein